MSRESPFPTVPVADALALVVGKAKGVPLQTETLATSSALGRVLATDVTASEPLPPFPASIKDGYALHVTEDTLAATKDRVFRVIDRIPAGADVSSFTSPLADDCMYQIMTGAAVPPNCNAVVMVEWTELLEKTEDGREAAVRLLKQVPKVGHDIRPVGSDLAPGTVVLEKGTRIGSPEVGLLASVGAREVSVYRRVRVAVMSTGDELLDVSRTDGSLVGAHGKIWDSNRPMLLAMVEELGGGMWEAIDEGIAADDMDGTTAAITRALETADVIISSGGVSMGDVDLVKGWLEQNSTLHFGRVLMKPGKPLTFATVAGSEGEKLFFATPGNPVSSMVTTLLFAIPALRVLSGLREHNHVRTQVVLEQSLRLDPQRPEFHRASVYWHAESSSLHAVSTGVQASSRLLSMRSANALLELPQREGTVAAGSKVSALLIGPILGNQPAIVRAASQHHCHHGHSHGHSHNHSHGHSHGHSHNHSHRGHGNGHSHGHSHTSHAHSHNHGSHSHGHSHGHQQAHNGEQ